MRVALDLEGVLADTHGRFLQLYNGRFGCNFGLEDINSWKFGKVRKDFNSRYSLPKRNTSEFLRGYKDWEGFYSITESLWRSQHPSISCLFDSTPDTLKESDLEIDIVTSRKRVKKQLRAWLEDNNLKQGNHYEKLRVEKNKHRLNYNIFVDDKPELHRKLADTGKKGIVVDQPWNQSLEAKDTHRISSLEGLDEVIHNLGR